MPTTTTAATVLPVGDRTLPLEIDADRLLAAYAGPDAEPADLGAEMRRQLSEPIGAPPLTRAVVPGDRVAIALDAGLPDAADCLIPVLDALFAAGVEPDAVTVVCGPDARPEWTGELEDRLEDPHDLIHVVVHDPDDPRANAFVHNTAGGRRVYVSRHFAEADATLVLGRAGHDPVLGVHGTGSHIWPTLGDREAIDHSRRLALPAVGREDKLRAVQACDEVAGLVGTFYAAAVSTDGRLWFGRTDLVQAQAQEHLREHWTVPADAPVADLVVASVAGACDWQRLATAAVNACRCAGERSAVLLLCDLTDDPGPAVRRLRGEPDYRELADDLALGDAPDRLAATQLAHALAGNRLFLLSGLTEGVAESLGFVAVGSPREAQNLVAKADSVVTIAQADLFRVR